ncbi:uncharacterized protein DSM5745_08629 [Aspergillus mulundensis]|uniref:Uncharacterized protein n=1 Tax=Aspergillus mulundensis TaxID=1810919 RepID=A0A3D8R4C5_9EURO|nr:hypothetical protein DSM5745_08629 [Aspergillus mulundensis]RDW68869.1 hypothetical protein DSM5745_08629 [Aspergillus mulundensis]
MSSLLALPNEILLMIIESLTEEWDIWSLIQANHRLYALGRPRLWRHNAVHENSEALIWAVETEQLDKMQYALDHGANVNCVNWHDETPLMIAVKEDRLDIVDFLLKVPNLDADFRHPKVTTKTALQLACLLGRLEIVERLIRRPEVRMDDAHNNILLRNAAEMGDTKQLALLLSDPAANPNLLSSYGYVPCTPLMAAVQSGRVEAARFLLDHPRNNLGTLDPMGSPALYYAFRTNRVEMVQLFLDRGADINQVFRNNDTMLCQAVKAGYENMVSFLLSRGADPSLGAPACIAADECDFRITKMFVDEPRVSGWQLGHVLNAAARHRQYELTELLMGRADIDVNHRGHKELTPLMAAISYNSSRSLEMSQFYLQPFILNSRVDINAQDADGRTAISIAAQLGRKNDVQVLLKHPAIDVNIPNNKGNTAMDLAQVYSHVEIVELLRSAGGHHSQQHLDTSIFRRWIEKIDRLYSFENFLQSTE